MTVKAVTKLWVSLYILMGFLVLCYIASPVFAQTPKSANYQFNETSVGGTGVLNTQSANYQALGTAGNVGQGNSASTNLQVYAGPTTTGDPALTFAITNPIASFGDFSPATAATATSTFEVTNYTSYGYVVQVIGDAPKNGNHTIAPIVATGPSQAGVEQFGINLVANTSPTSLGANPDHGQFGFGNATSNYGTPNNYRFVSGESIVSAPKSSGKTIYTISYIINVNSLTPAGQYTNNQTLICTGTY